MIAITAASGQLGRLVVEALLRTVPADQIVAAVRDPQKVADLAARGVQVRVADYERPETLDAAFAGVEQVLLISSNAIGARTAQHQNAIEAAKRAGVGLLAYTSILRADDSPLDLAGEHLETERALAASGVPFVLLRNGWYLENHASSIAGALAHGAYVGAAGDGRISGAARADYADAAAAVLTAAEPQAGKVYELGGDVGFTYAELAQELGVPYTDLPEAAYKDVLLGAGLPGFLAELFAQSDAGAAQGGLYDETRTLSRLIGRPTADWRAWARAQVPAAAAR